MSRVSRHHLIYKKILKLNTRSMFFLLKEKDMVLVKSRTLQPEIIIINFKIRNQTCKVTTLKIERKESSNHHG